VATSDAAFRGGACPTPEYTIAYTGNYTTSADANNSTLSWWELDLRDAQLPVDCQRMESIKLLSSKLEDLIIIR
jgi:hypothetical protein